MAREKTSFGLAEIQPWLRKLYFGCTVPSVAQLIDEQLASESSL